MKIITSKNSIEPHAGCISSAMDVIAEKWTALILRDLSSGPVRFSQLEQSIKGINPRILSRRLDALESHGIVNKIKYSESPPRIEYDLTQKGKDIIPVVKQMANWGEKYYSV